MTEASNLSSASATKTAAIGDSGVLSMKRTMRDWLMADVSNGIRLQKIGFNNFILTVFIRTLISTKSAMRILRNNRSILELSAALAHPHHAGPAYCIRLMILTHLPYHCTCCD